MPEVHTLFTRNNPFHFHYTAPDTHPDVEGLFTSLFFYSVTTASRCKKERKKEKKKGRKKGRKEERKKRNKKSSFKISR